MKCIVENLGLTDYKTAWKLQDQYAAEIAAGTRLPTLLLVEHPHVFTFGRRGQIENLLWSEAELAERGVSVHWVDRGGDVTYHGPGQLVGYPLLPLGMVNAENHIPQADYVGYVRNLEKMLIVALARLGVVAGQVPGLTGVWIQADVWSRCPRCRPQDRQQPAKIAAIGVKVDARGISRHGFALNIDPEMTYFNGIIACGLVDHSVVALADLKNPLPAMVQVQEAVVSAFGEVFRYEMVIQSD